MNARRAKACLVFLCGVYCTVGGSHARAQQKLSPRVNATGGVGAEGCFFKNSPLVHFVALSVATKY